AAVVAAPAQRLLQLVEVLVERPTDVEVPVLEVVEVQRALLRLAELVREDGVHRPPDDGALDLGARVDPDDGGGVVDRVEVVVPRLALQRLLAEPRPDRGLRIVEVDARPLRRVPRVRPDDHAGLVAARAQRGEPPPDERDLVARDEPGRAHVQGDRPVCPQTDARAELLAHGARLPVEPVVVRPRAEHADPVARDLLQLDRLAGLDLVPDQHRLGQLVDEALVRQVVPAEHRIGAVQPEPVGGADVVGLDGVARQVRDDDDVGREVLEEPDDVRRRVEAPLRVLERALEAVDGPRPERVRRTPEAPYERAGVLLGAGTQSRRVLVGGLQIAEVVRVDPQAAGEALPADGLLRPAGRAAGRQAAEGQVLELVREPLEHLVRLGLHAAEGEVDAVTALVQQPEDRRQRPDRGRVPHDEEELHPGSEGTARLRRMTAPAETPAYSPFLDDVQAFEQAVLAQQRVQPEHYDDEYFVAGWREGGNRYDLETRRRVEDRNPALIGEVFEPRRVLDVGC